MAEVHLLCHSGDYNPAMLSLLALLLILAPAPQQAPPPQSGTFISAEEVATTLKQSIANNVVDQPIKGLSVNGHRASVAMLHRKVAETTALVHDRVTEIYQVMEGSGTIVTGGTLVDPKPNDLTRLGAGPSQTGSPKGGESRRVGPKDIIIIPAGMPHHFSQLDGPISYLVYRFDPKP
jgi:mannose-6-phosphate isomerase-like protein (cupin superfamily)